MHNKRRRAAGLVLACLVWLAALQSCAFEANEEFGSQDDNLSLPAAEQVGISDQALIGALPLTTRNYAFVLVDVGGGVGLTSTEAYRKMFGMSAGDKSIKQYFREASYGMQDIGGNVFGPLNFPMTHCDNSTTRALATTLRAQIPGTFDHYIWYFGTRVPSCSWSHLTSVGSPDQPSRDSWFNSSSLSCTYLVQMPMNNIGMKHSSSLDCDTEVLKDDPNVCRHGEYGDRFDVMGGGSCAHMNAWQKTYRGWHGRCNSVRVGRSGTYTLFPIEAPCNGIQVLQIPMAKARPYSPLGGSTTLRYYYLELRTNVGFDAGLGGLPTVLVHVADQYQQPTQLGMHTWLLDMNPATSNFDGLGAGGSFTDPAGGVTFTVQSISQSQASVDVIVPNGTSGTSVCLDGSSVAPPGPTNCSN